MELDASGELYQNARKGVVITVGRTWFIPLGVISASTTTVTDKLTGKVVGKPYWGELDVRFDEGAGGIVLDVDIYPDV